MNKLSSAERAHILQLLCEGMSIRAIERVTGKSKHTITNLLNAAGAALGAYQDQAFRELKCANVQVDEIWSFTYAKEKNVKHAKAAPEGAGDTWTWTAICSDSKLVFSVMVGGRDGEYAYEFLSDVRARIKGRFQLTSDGFPGYYQAAKEALGLTADYAMLVKTYGIPAGEGPERRYSPAQVTSIKKRRISGKPNMATASTSYVERQNLTMRMHMRRFTRLTNGFSKKVENHVNAISLHFAYYNLVKVHKTLRTSPAMAAGVTDRLWEMTDLVGVLEATEEAPKKRGPYKKRID